MKLAFVHNPKCAGASIKSWARDNHLIKENTFVHVGHCPINVFKERNPEITYDKSLVVIRNTYTRILSLYNWAEIKIPKLLAQSKKRNFSEERINELHNALKIWNKGIVYYTDYITNADNYWTQLDYIKDVDVIINYENLKNEFSKIQELTNCHSPLTHTIHSYTNKKVLKMSTEYINCIKRNFKEELNYFGYLPY